MKYRVAVTELLRKEVVVEARNEAEAHRRASDAWENGEYRLDGRDFDGAEFHVIGETTDDDQELEKVDGKNLPFQKKV